MRKLILLLAIFIMVAFITAPVFAKEKEGNTQDQTTFRVENPNHNQSLGGKSARARKGLENASGRSNRVKKIEQGSGSKDIVDVVTDTDPGAK